MAAEETITPTQRKHLAGGHTRWCWKYDTTTNITVCKFTGRELKIVSAHEVKR